MNKIKRNFYAALIAYGFMPVGALIMSGIATCPVTAARRHCVQQGLQADMGSHTSAKIQNNEDTVRFQATRGVQRNIIRVDLNNNFTRAVLPEVSFG